MTARLYCSLVAVLLCPSVCWSVRNNDDRFTDKPKPGVCPKTTLGGVVCKASCSHDSDCPNDEKCCSNRCGRQCMAPFIAKPKPGVCPNKNPGVERICSESCSHDSDCPKDEKCCSTGFRYRCTAPYRAKPGVCPVIPLGGVCKDSCVDDSDCPKTEKCCSNACGRQCRAPYMDRPKPGVCPSKMIVLGVCTKSCSYDSDCPDDDKCCSTKCGGRQCVTPGKCYAPSCRQLDP
ncbi:uncharacterized protein LOC143735481 [Siphateles boraxobius]|uniref:uncharacterized protein LOC143735481 n=1 Tax=Siphateles boraxobius TaxID=180520 RepID=UPI004063F1CA